MVMTIFAPCSATPAGSPRPFGVTAQLISEVKTIVPGQTFTVALSLKHANGYHTYWENPGTVGLPTSLKWTLPRGFKAGAIQWQVPEKCKMLKYDAHGYNGDALLLVDITAPAKFPDGSIELKATGGWMVCSTKLCCQLGYEDLVLKIKVGKTRSWHKQHRSLIAEGRRKLPKRLDGWTSSGQRQGDQIILKFKRTDGLSVSHADSIYFYSRQRNHISTLIKQQIRVNSNEVTIVLPIAEYAPKKIERITGLLYHPNGWPGADGRKFMPVDLALK